MNQKYANYLLDKTKDDYNLIGHDFSSKRAWITPDLQELKKYAKENNKVLDLGCGNGRLVEIFKDLKIDYYGVDTSETLIEIAKDKYPQYKFQIIDFFSLPFPDNYFDNVYCLSVLHHIPSVEYRINFLKEINRVLKNKGILVLTVWNLLAKKDIILSVIKNALANIFGKSQLDFKDVLLPFRRSKNNNLADRYLHCFTKKELKKIIQKAGLNILEFGTQDRGKKVVNQNLYAIAQKK